MSIIIVHLPAMLLINYCIHDLLSDGNRTLAVNAMSDEDVWAEQ